MAENTKTSPGWLVAAISIAAWIAFPFSWLEASSALMPVWAFLAAVLSLAAYGGLQQFTPSYQCKRCHKQMTVYANVSFR